MNSGKDFSKETDANDVRKRHWNQSRKQRVWEEDRFAALAATHTTVLNGIFLDTSVSCLQRIAENSSVPARMLEQLATHPDPAIREAVADNVNTPVDTVLLLASDESCDVRYAMAENHNLPISVLSVLIEDENPYVACRARTTLDRIIGGTVCEPNFWVRRKNRGRVAG
jgi:hypothetical protein